ncbi:hypothetical protein BSG1_20595 [Bacillus sp. SG-1]|nr:hypothetical protein BSG1_20595 [Bacillus sp. SG-1]
MNNIEINYCLDCGAKQSKNEAQCENCGLDFTFLYSINPEIKKRKSKPTKKEENLP